MGLRVFVSYSGHEDQVAALRLQTLAGTRPELQVYVPPVSTRNRRGAPTGADLKALNDSRFVLAIISGVVPPAMQQELAVAQRAGKTIVPIVVRGRGNVAGIQADQPVFYLDPYNPVETEKQIIDYVSSAVPGKSNQQAALGLVLLLLGMLILAKE